MHPGPLLISPLPSALFSCSTPIAPGNRKVGRDGPRTPPARPFLSPSGSPASGTRAGGDVSGRPPTPARGDPGGARTQLCLIRPRRASRTPPAYFACKQSPHHAYTSTSRVSTDATRRAGRPRPGAPQVHAAACARCRSSGGTPSGTKPTGSRTREGFCLFGGPSSQASAPGWPRPAPTPPARGASGLK